MDKTKGKKVKVGGKKKELIASRWIIVANERSLLGGSPWGLFKHFHLSSLAGVAQQIFSSGCVSELQSPRALTFASFAPPSYLHQSSSIRPRRLHWPLPLDHRRIRGQVSQTNQECGFGFFCPSSCSFAPSSHASHQAAPWRPYRFAFENSLVWR